VRPRLASLCGLTWVLAVGASPAHSQPETAASTAPRWDSLSAIVQAARTGGLIVRAPILGDTPAEALGPEVRPGDALWIHDVEAAPDPEALLAHARRGGRVLVADERPEAVALFSALGFRLGPPPAPDLPRYGGHPALVPARPTAALGFEGVTRVVTNHAARLEPAASATSLLEFDDGIPLMQRAPYGDGVLIALADASLCVDLMHEVADNARFCAALMTYLADEGQHTVHVFTSGPNRVSAGADEPPSAPPGGGLRDQLEVINTRLADLGVHRPTEALLRAFVALLVAATTVFAVAQFPGLRGRRPSPRPSPRPRLAPQKRSPPAS